MRRLSSLILRMMQSSPGDSLMTSTATSWGCPAMARLSSSVTLMKKRRCIRRSPPKPMLRLLLLQGSWPQPPTPMKHLRGCKMIMVMIRPLTRQPMVAAMAEMKSVHLRLSDQGDACFKENFNDSTLLLHILFLCRGEGIVMQSH
jgi:hypothetical protein